MFCYTYKFFVIHVAFLLHIFFQKSINISTQIYSFFFLPYLSQVMNEAIKSSVMTPVAMDSVALINSLTGAIGASCAHALRLP